MENQKLLKLVKFDTKDALDKDDLTCDEIDELFKGTEDYSNGSMTNNKRIFNKPSSPELLTDKRSEIRIYAKFMPQGELIKTLIFFEVIVHQDIEDLDNNVKRSVEITRELYKSLKTCNAIGKLNFNNNLMNPMHFGKDFYGYMFHCKTHLSSRFI